MIVSSKVSLIQSTEEEALSPPELQSRITDILTSSPNIAEAVSFVCSTCKLVKKYLILRSLVCGPRVRQ